MQKLPPVVEVIELYLLFSNFHTSHCANIRKVRNPINNRRGVDVSSLGWQEEVIRDTFRLVRAPRLSAINIHAV